jgi:hypothetical protein
MSLEDFKSDLTRRISDNLIPTIPSYTNNMKLKKKIEITYRMLRRASILRDRTLMMINAFYLGQLLEKETFSPAQRTYLKSMITKYYYTASIRTYFIFEFLGPEQIQHSRYLSLPGICSMKKKDYQSLREEAMLIWSGNQNLGEEIETGRN